jgi:O-antigen/teichoic acid export membrane protein
VTGTTVEKTESIGRKAGRGLGWGLLGNVVSRLGSFATGLVLARLLVPDDFGVFAVALAATQFVIHINDVGLIPATIQWRGRLEEMAATATTIAGGFSLVVYLGFWFAAPWFADFAGVPEATPVVRLFTATILIDGITAVRSAYLLRTFQQSRYVRANMAGIVANAAVAVTMAAAGAGPMALAGGQLASSLATGTLVWVWAGLPLRVGIDRAIARKLLAYGIPLTGSLAVEAVLEQADKVIIGRLMGATVLGFYLLAFNISSWVPGIVGSAIRYVSLPGFSRLSEKDSDALSAGVQRAIPLLVIALIPIATLLAVLAGPTITFLYGGKWLAAAQPLRFLMVLMVVRMLYGIGMDILMSTAATRSALVVNLGWAAAIVPALWIGTKLDGGRGAAITQAIVGLVIALPLIVLALRMAQVRLAPIVPRLVRPLLACAFAGTVAVLLHLVAGPNAFVQLVVAGTAGLLAYLATAVPLGEWREWLAALRRERAHAVAE